MRFHEIASGLRVPVSSEEQRMLDRIAVDGSNISDMDERSQEVARRMVSRGLLDAVGSGDEPKHLRVNSSRDIWRETW